HHPSEPPVRPRARVHHDTAPPHGSSAGRNHVTQFTTSQTGTPVGSDAHSLTTGPDGATALHDRYLVEKLAQFNRERIPERIVHAKGGGAFGEMVVTED